jgi:hypothetical protein
MVANDDLPITFKRQKTDGTPVAFDSATLTVFKAKSDGTDYTLSGTVGTGIATFQVPPNTLGKLGRFTASIVTSGSSPAARRTLEFTVAIS